MSKGYNGVRNASSLPVARTDAAEKFVDVSPAVGLGPSMRMIKKIMAEKLYIGISFLFKLYD